MRMECKTTEFRVHPFQSQLSSSNADPLLIYHAKNDEKVPQLSAISMGKISLELTWLGLGSISSGACTHQPKTGVIVVLAEIQTYAEKRKQIMEQESTEKWKFHLGELHLDGK